ncbi:hypothetical protein GTU79_10815 [Sodalis ligni]|uniref:hypothetical protein n=1 Tax=Sodalis ligni TaxID=2697027 RepID=UPI001BDED907|nr:hypothetical protein [Sodalis ligni]QWA13103.1 hypothetical protein GTU79_10815 [Sodalis ligni]
MPFNVNYMDATEFSHVVRGLMLGKPEVYNLSQLKHIDLYSCFSGFGGKYSMAQVLANELQVQIKAYPYYISQTIERRHPSWFTTYRPMGADDADNKTVTFTPGTILSCKALSPCTPISMTLSLIWRTYEENSGLSGKNAHAQAIRRPLAYPIYPAYRPI